MRRWHGVWGVFALGLMLLAANSGRAERVPSTKVISQPNPGARGDITVPYMTNGRTTLGVYNGAAPKLYSSPGVDDKNTPGASRTYNIIFYGSKQGFGTMSNGATPRPPFNPNPR